MVKVSVVIPTYNSAEPLKEALDSVLAQTYPIHEIIVVDDGSRDNTVEIVKEYLLRRTKDEGRRTYTPRPTSHVPRPTEHAKIKYIRQKNRGPAAARNRGIREAIGEYIAFLDADDIWLPNKIEKQMKLFENSNYALVYSDMSHMVEGRIIHKSYLKEKGYRFFGSGDVYHNLLKENFIFTPTVVMKKEIINTVGYFDESYRICEDYKMWLNIARKYYIGFVNEPLVIRRRLKTNITEDKFLYTQSWFRLFEELLKNNGFNPQVRGIIQHQLKRHSFDLGYHYWKNGDIASARHSFIRALLCKSNIIKTMPYLVASYMVKKVHKCISAGVQECRN